MKSVLRLTAAGVALATFGFATSASAADGNATVTAEILSNLTITANATDSVLNFGSIAADPTLAANSTVVVSPTDVLTCGTLLTCTGTAAAPSFTVTGLAGQAVAVTFPSSSVQLDRGATLGTMERYMDVDNFTTSTSTVTLTGGTGTFSIGGTLNVRPNQAPGVYTGSVTVRVEYN